MAMTMIFYLHNKQNKSYNNININININVVIFRFDLSNKFKYQKLKYFQYIFYIDKIKMQIDIFNTHKT